MTLATPTTNEAAPGTAGIPEPPRDVRWRTCLARRYAFGLVGGLLLALGLGIFLAGLFAAGGSPLDDSVLDSGQWTATGKITDVRQVPAGFGGTVWRVEYEFETKQGTVFGASYAPELSADMQEGEPCTIEYADGRPDINRMEGTQCSHFDPTMTHLVTILTLLGIIGVHLWFRSVLRLRIALREGPLTTAQIIQAKVLKHVTPRPVSVQYRFQDNLGVEQVASHWVAAKSQLGRHLIEQQPREHAVIHDENNPGVSRLVHAEDFLS